MAEWHTETVEECLSKRRLGSIKKLQTQYYQPSGRFPVIDQGQTPIAGWTDDASGLISHDLPVVVFGDHTRVFKYVDFPFVRGADGTQVMKPRPDIDPLFFYYALRAIDLPSRGYNRHFKALKEKELSIPGDTEQIDIARALKSIDDALVVQDQEIALLVRCKSSTMRTLFMKGLRGEVQKETEIGPIPKSWNVVPFQNVREWLQYGTSTRCTYAETNCPVLRIPNIEPGQINLADLKFAKLSVDKADRFRLKNGDLIFVRTNGVIERLGACAVYVGNPKGALFASYLIRARLRLDQIVPRYATSFFSSDLGTSIVAGRATPAADGKYNLNTGMIDSLPLPLPHTLDEQREILAVLDAIDHKIELHRRKRAVLEELFKSLLHKLMTGGIRVADLDLSALAFRPTAEVAA